MCPLFSLCVQQFESLGDQTDDRCLYTEKAMFTSGIMTQVGLNYFHLGRFYRVYSSTTEHLLEELRKDGSHLSKFLP